MQGGGRSKGGGVIEQVGVGKQQQYATHHLQCKILLSSATEEGEEEETSL